MQKKERPFESIPIERERNPEMEKGGFPREGGDAPKIT